MRRIFLYLVLYRSKNRTVRQKLENYCFYMYVTIMRLTKKKKKKNNCDVIIG